MGPKKFKSPLFEPFFHEIWAPAFGLRDSGPSVAPEEQASRSFPIQEKICSTAVRHRLSFSLHFSQPW